MSREKKNGLLFSTAFLLMGLIFAGYPVLATESEEDCDKNKPERLITMAAEYTGVEAKVGEEDISLDIIFHNKGRSDENVNIAISEIPENWKAGIKTYKFGVTGIHVKSGEKKTVNFEAEPNKDIQPGTYQFKVEAQTPDGEFKMAQNLIIALKPKEEGETKAKGVKLTTSYPVLRGPSDGKFEFSMDVESKLDKDAIFDLFAQGPEGWDINFKPAYETKFISSLRLKENQNTTVAVEVKPAANSKEEEYPLKIRVSSGDAKAEADLTIILTGTYQLEVGTINDLLSMDARQGKPANMSIYVKNTGSAINKEIKFMSFKPENWKVEFKPEKIEAINPGDLKQVEVIITPFEEALVGDYSVNVNVEGEKVSKPIEFRITVKASTSWAWIGVGIIVLVILSLTALFRKLGRR